METLEQPSDGPAGPSQPPGDQSMLDWFCANVVDDGPAGVCWGHQSLHNAGIALVYNVAMQTRHIDP